ncbi:MAG: hypothetical protein O7B35_19205 [Deltaproteobacteria bacterium]|nr:hypothetical protein [Deltaproteobacteria bacterium]
MAGLVASVGSKYLLAIPSYIFMGYLVGTLGNMGIVVSVALISGFNALVGGIVAALLSRGHEIANSIVTGILSITLTSFTFWTAILKIPTDFEKLNWSTLGTLGLYPLAPVFLSTIAFSLAAGALIQRIRIKKVYPSHA